MSKRNHGEVALTDARKRMHAERIVAHADAMKTQRGLEGVRVCVDCGTATEDDCEGCSRPRCVACANRCGHLPDAKNVCLDCVRERTVEGEEYHSHHLAPCGRKVIATFAQEVHPSTEDLSRVECPQCLAVVKAIVAADRKAKRASEK